MTNTTVISRQEIINGIGKQLAAKNPQIVNPRINVFAVITAEDGKQTDIDFDGIRFVVQGD